MSFGGAMFALTAVQAVNQISAGYAQKAEANYNAAVYNEQAKIIDMQGDIEGGRYQRLKGEYMSRSNSVIAAQGIAPQGSALAAMVNAQTQINKDQAISRFNYDQEAGFTRAQASAYKRQGAAAVRSAYSGAFSSLLSGASNYAMYKGKQSTFDSVSNKEIVKRGTNAVTASIAGPSSAAYWR